MLVLGRRLNERLVFPSVPATIQVVAVQGVIVRLGITAPPEVPVLREEICQGRLPSQLPAAPSERVPTREGLRHSLRNRLEHLGLGLAFLEQKLSALPLSAVDDTLQAMNRGLLQLGEELKTLLGEDPLPEPLLIPASCERPESITTRRAVLPRT